MPVDARKETGLIGYRRDLAWPGYTLYTPLSGKGEVYLIDMQGDIVQRWQFPLPPGSKVCLLENGNLLYAGRSAAGATQFGGKGGVLYEVGWEGDIVWEYRNDVMHHDFDRLPNGNTMVLIWEPVPTEMHASIKGGVPGTEHDGVMWGDAFLEIAPGGEVVWEWHGYEHLDGEEDRICPLCPRSQWTHANSLQAVELPDGKRAILTSFRWQNTVALIDRANGAWLWKWGRDDLGHQHDVSLLDNGNVLLFDNGLHYVVNRKHMAQQIIARGTTRSRLLEVDPASDEICWQYVGTPRYAFFSPFLSGAQRLPNGNTLACEGITGRFLEVTRHGDIVWEYVAPFFGDFRDYGSVNMCFRCYRYGPEYPGLAGRDVDPKRYRQLNHLVRSTGGV